ncbi:Meiotically up-regulated [Hyphodiscus hymeniophilus]|uniref:Meiotically up-regulated n=1 Tax=Hyphodiscus hymeniophilus TaxID=353542 RepID=A0A9P6VR35_9HELO|nr:Meiotically up-regulated [Hyphodiscus hymeniophilus]
MSYQQTTAHLEANRTTNNMYTPQFRAHHDSHSQGSSYSQGPVSGNDNVNSLLGSFAGVSLASGNMASGTTMGAQVPVGASTQLYVTADGQLFCAPGMYPTQSLASTQLPDNAYNAYTATMPYVPQNAYPGYLAGYPTMTPYAAAARGYYSGSAEYLHKDVPGLENRRGSYSTNESAPGTPYYGSVSLRDHGTLIAQVDRSPFGSTPSPQGLPAQHIPQPSKLPFKTIPVDIDIDALLQQHPAIPHAVPAVFTPRESMRTLDQSLSNPIPGNRNVYIRGLHPNTDDETLAAYAARFGKVETSKAIIDTATGACKGFGFAKYVHVRESELCIRGFYKLGYEVGFARESFNSRLKAEGDEQSTNLYVSNLPKNMTESELGAIFMDYTVSSSRILRDSQNNSRGVGFARFESRDVCEEVIRKFHGQPIGEEGLLLQVRYADTPAQKDLKRITTERRQFRTNEYNIGAYGGSVIALSPPLSVASPLLPRASQIASHFPTGSSRSSGSWKREQSLNSSTSVGASIFKDNIRHARKVSFSEPSARKNKDDKVSSTTPTLSEDGSVDDGVTIHCDSPAVAYGGSQPSPSARKA